MAKISDATDAVQAYLAKADALAVMLERGIHPDELKAVCEELLSLAQQASAANKDITQVDPTDADLVSANNQRILLIEQAQIQNTLIQTVLDALKNQTQSQMRAIKSALSSSGPTYSAKGRPEMAAPGRTISKA